MMTKDIKREYAYIFNKKKFSTFMQLYIIIYILILIISYYINFIFEFYKNISLFYVFTLIFSMALFVTLSILSNENGSTFYGKMMILTEKLLINPFAFFLFIVVMFVLSPFFITVDEKIIHFSGGIFYPFIVAASHALSLVLLPEIVIGMRGMFSPGKDKT